MVTVADMVLFTSPTAAELILALLSSSPSPRVGSSPRSAHHLDSYQHTQLLVQYTSAC